MSTRFYLSARHAPPAARGTPAGRARLRRALFAGAWLLLVGAIGVLVPTALVPQIMGATTVIATSNAMAPAVRAGDLLVIKPLQAADGVAVGDIVTFQPDPASDALMTRRVAALEEPTGATGAGVVACADAINEEERSVPLQQVRGRLVYGVPLLGYVAQSVYAERLWFAAGAVAALVAILALAVVSMVRRRT